MGGRHRFVAASASRANDIRALAAGQRLSAGSVSVCSMEQKELLHRYLRRQRDALLSKLDGLGERDIRWPMTRTGTNLLGLVKHTASMELGYFGEVFGRPSDIPLPWLDDGAEANADMWATAQESREQIIELRDAAAAHADATIDALDIDAPGLVPWWRPEKRDVTLHVILVHMCVEMARHAGHADIVRELIDGDAGDKDGNLADLTADEWRAHRLRIEHAATEAAASG